MELKKATEEEMKAALSVVNRALKDKIADMIKGPRKTQSSKKGTLPNTNHDNIPSDSTI